MQLSVVAVTAKGGLRTSAALGTLSQKTSILRSPSVVCSCAALGL